MAKQFLLLLILTVFCENFLLGCLITNCPRGGKRSGRLLLESNIKPCVSCGPGHTGQCFGPNICCGPFGCLLNTPETIKCQKEGFFHEREPCIAGNSSCRKNTGRCATDGICCNQDACHVDRLCSVMEDKVLPKFTMQDLSNADSVYNMLSNYQNSFETGDN